MNILIAHAVIASLALFMPPEGPPDRTDPPADARGGGALKAGSAARPVEAAKKDAPARAGGAGQASGTAKKETAKAGVGAPAATAKPLEAKPCEPVKPCSID